MITPIDIFCLAIAVVVIAGESQRGVWVALLDLGGIIGVVYLARYAFHPLEVWVSTPSAAYLLVFVVGVVVVAGISAYVSLRTRERIRNWECAAGAFVGMCTAAALSYGILRFITMKYGAGAPFVSDSLLAYGLAEHGVLYELTRFMRTLMGR